MAKQQQKQQQQTKGGSNMEQPDLKVITNSIQAVKTVGSNDQDVEIAGAIVDGAIKQAELRVKEAEVNAQAQVKMKEIQFGELKLSKELEERLAQLERESSERIEKRKMELEHRRHIVDKAWDGIKSVAMIAGVTTVISVGLANDKNNTDY